jgi:hypothetical protein
MFLDGISISHAGDIIADRALEPALFDEALDVIGQNGRLGLITIEQV